jgi:hypothetical protein
VASRTGYQDEPNSFRLSDKTICMETKFGDAVDEHLHYEVHNLYGYMQSIATQQYVYIPANLLKSTVKFFILFIIEPSRV